MIIHAYYDDKNIFGEWEFCRDVSVRVNTMEALQKAVNKCFSSFGKLNSFSFSVVGEQADDVMLIEQNSMTDDAKNGVFTVMHRRDNEADAEQKMSAAAVRKAIKRNFERENNLN